MSDDEVSSTEQDDLPDEPLSPEFRQALIAAVGRPLRVRSHILLLAGHAAGHLLGADSGCRVCFQDWPCETVRRAAAPALEAFADCDDVEGKLRAALGAAEAKVRAVERVHCWTNEDGKRFMFADDVAVALEIPGVTGGRKEKE